MPETVVSVGAVRVPVRGRLAFLISELLAHQEELQLDHSDFGKIEVTWGSGQMRMRVERFLTSAKEPG